MKIIYLEDGAKWCVQFEDIRTVEDDLIGIVPVLDNGQVDMERTLYQLP